MLDTARLTSAQFKERFPEFDSLTDGQVDVALEESAEVVGSEWSEKDQKLAQGYHAAYLLATSPGSGGSSGEVIKSINLGGAISLTYQDAGGGTAEPTDYHAKYRAIVKRNVGGPMVV